MFVVVTMGATRSPRSLEVMPYSLFGLYASNVHYFIICCLWMSYVIVIDMCFGLITSTHLASKTNNFIRGCGVFIV